VPLWRRPTSGESRETDAAEMKKSRRMTEKGGGGRKTGRQKQLPSSSCVLCNWRVLGREWVKKIENAMQKRNSIQIPYTEEADEEKEVRRGSKKNRTEDHGGHKRDRVWASQRASQI
jgi:hypothetical protein